VSRRVQLFLALTVACVVAAGVLVAVAATRTSHQRADQKKAVAQSRGAVLNTINNGKAFAVFRDLDRTHSSTYGFLSVAPLNQDGTPGKREPAGTACARVAFAAGHGICLDTVGTAMDATLLDAQLKPTHHLTLTGVPSRARISPDGRWAGTTAFVVGHAYAAPGQFSTVATIIDVATGRKVGELERDFRITIDGRPFDARDRNFWGLTFAADGDTFYATAADRTRTWLIKGSIRNRTATAIHENVECPSLSPDGTRIAYKKAVRRDPTVWRFTVLDLASGKETPLAETRSIDDQLSWLDDGHVLYADADETTWTVPADGTGRPQVWMKAADSPTVASATASN
jgi:WD40-like Beta Propeller Repeat